VVLIVAAVATLAASLAIIGGDALWLVPLGHEVAHGHLPSSIPYASASTTGWHDVPAGAELVFWTLYRVFGGDRGLLLAQTLAAAVGFGTLAAGLRREASAGAALIVPVVVLVGALPTVVVVGISLFSLAIFPVLLGLLAREAREPSRRIWLSVPLLALWGNLHGGVLVGFGLLFCYLVFDRARREPWLAGGVLAAGAAALFATPELWRTPLYYTRVFHSQVARHGEGLWAPLGTRGVDVLLEVIAAVLVALTVLGRGRIRLWEAVALIGLAAATLHVARNGTWLLFLAAYPAARAIRLGAPKPRLLIAAAVIVAAGAVAAVVRGPIDPGSRALARVAAKTGAPVLASTLLGQQVAAAGGHVWVNNPIDAFRQADQRLFLDWNAGNPSGSAAVAHADYVLVPRGSDLDRISARDPRLTLVTRDGGGALYRIQK
jgi:hypothetical protein